MKRGGSLSHKPNILLFLSIFALIAIGAVLVSSASVVQAQLLTGDPNHFLREHIYALLGGAFLMIFGYLLEYRFWKKMAPAIIIVSVILLVLVFVPGVGFEHGGARRWIQWPFFFSPTEVFKLAIIIYLAAWLDKKRENLKSFLYSTVPFSLILISTGALIMLQPDMDTFMVIAAVAGAMYFVAGASIPHIILMAGAGIAAAALLIKTSAYRLERFMVFLNPGTDKADGGYQINQALMAIGSGGIFGLGLGQSRQKFHYLPEASTDTIFAVAAEELGFLRIMLILLLYFIVAREGFKIAKKAPDYFSRFLAVGITLWITFQAIFNIFTNLALTPVAGITLPFISMGSTATLVLMLASGILLNISKHTEGETREDRVYRRRNWWSYIAGFGSNKSNRR